MRSISFEWVSSGFLMGLCEFCKFCDEMGVDAFLDKDSGASCTDLALICAAHQK